MLFNSPEFLFVFLPITLIGYYLLGRWNRRAALGFLVFASLGFYGYWRAPYLLIIVLSTLGNYSLGLRLSRGGASKRWLLVLGVGANLGLLGYYKYTGFFLDTLSAFTGVQGPTVEILLPLGISFFTFQQIAYLVDASRGEAKELNLARYGLFVVFFPQLIAGPIVHHKDVLQQLRREGLFRLKNERLAIGLSLFIMGLFKKIVVADGLAEWSSPAFHAAADGQTLSVVEAWAAALSYTFQLYFDFSGYSDMALGLGRLFGIRLPQNFNSPYRATSIVHFWQCWHITLSRFLRDYLYIPLGGNRKGPVRRYVNLAITMLLGGLWHGAGWTFVIWGGLHGFYLCVNHAFRALVPKPFWVDSRMGKVIPWTFTFLAVVVAWVFFRAPTLESALTLLRTMFLIDAVHLPNEWAARLGPVASVLGAWGASFDLTAWPHFYGATQLAVLFGLGVVCVFLPNSCELTSKYRPALAVLAHPHRALLPFRFRLTPRWAVAVGVMGLITLGHLQRVSEFLYFQF